MPPWEPPPLTPRCMIHESTRKTETAGLAVKVGAVMGAVVLSMAACGGTLEGKYRRGELPGHPVPTTKNPQGAIPVVGSPVSP